ATERQAIQETLQGAQHAERPREVEEELHALDAEAGAAHALDALTRPQQDRVAIERDAAHDEARSGVQRVVLEERQPSTVSQAPVDRGKAGVSLRKWDVVEDTVAIAEIKRPERRPALQIGKDGCRVRRPRQRQ